MKRIILLVFISSVITASAQTPYYDALFLKNWATKRFGTIPPDTLKKISGILCNYNPADCDLNDAIKTIDSFTSKNPFFASYFSHGSGQGNGLPFAKIFNSPLSSLGGINVTNFADGLAKFLVKRFKQELSITFFTNFKNDVKKNDELKTLFPQTYQLFIVIDDEIYAFSKYLNSLREAFIKDLSNWYTDLKKLKALPKYQSFLDAHLEIKTVVVNAFYIIDQFSAGTHPGEMIANYKEEELINLPAENIQTDLRSCIKTLKLFSNSLRSSSIDNYWVPADSIRALLGDPVGRDLYFGLVYEKSADIKFKHDGQENNLQNFLKIAKSDENTLRQYQLHIEAIADHTEEVNEYITVIKGKKKSEIDYNDYYNLFNAGLDILNEGLFIVDLLPLNNSQLITDIKTEASHWMETARNIGEFYVDVRTKKYSSAVLSSVRILDVNFNVDDKTRTNIIKYGTFIASVANAENSDDVEDAIESVALPVGSASIKRNSVCNIALNGYLGGFGGSEYLKENPGKKWAPIVGVYAPVGVAFSTRFGNAGSASIFLSAIDIGAFASFRLNDDSTKALPEVSLKNIFAPGLGFIYGIPKVPISLGWSWQYGPMLRELNRKDEHVEINASNRPNHRWQFFLAVDIPIVNFYNKSK
jgi:hypothetical protein